MRKPMFLASLWLRARFDVEYLGLSIPDTPMRSDSLPLIERDLDVIGATHAERLEAERIRLKTIHMLRWVRRLLVATGFDYSSLAQRTAKDFPHLTERRCEIIRAITIAYLVDFDDIRSLSASIQGLHACMEYAADARSDLDVPPNDLPPIASPASVRWRPGKKSWMDFLVGSRRVLRLPCFPKYQLWQQRRIRQFFHRHRRWINPWIDVMLTQGQGDPFAILEKRILDIVRRVDLWSDQLVTLRTVQTLALLDIDHYCRLVWQMGKYEELETDDSGEQPGESTGSQPAVAPSIP
jgi:hypothetical protein